MLAELFSDLDVLRIELRVRALESVSLPPFLGSTLRGAFGTALKHTVCVMPHRNCQRCMVPERCIYSYLFETPVPPDIPQLRGQERAPRPFILSPPAPGAAIVKRMPIRLASAAGANIFNINRAKPAPTPPVLRKASILDQADSKPQDSFKSSALTSKVNRSKPFLRTTFSGAREWTPIGSFEFGGETKANPPSGRRLNLNAGDEIGFELLLIGRAVEYLPYMLYAVTEMSRRGLGADRARFELTEVLMVDAQGQKQQIYLGDSTRIASVNSVTSLSELILSRLEQLKSAPGFRDDSLSLRFITPARIRVGGDLQAEMNFQLLVRNLLRRGSLLCAVHGKAPLNLEYRRLIERAGSVKTLSSRLHWSDWERYSNRQQTKMKMGGLTGEIKYGGEVLVEFLSLIVMGELLHIGTGTSFGLGRYEIASGESS